VQIPPFKLSKPIAAEEVICGKFILDVINLLAKSGIEDINSRTSIFSLRVVLRASNLASNLVSRVSIVDLR